MSTYEHNETYTHPEDEVLEETFIIYLRPC